MRILPFRHVISHRLQTETLRSSQQAVKTKVQFKFKKP